jgi:uncharacterized protein YjiK
VFFLAKSSNSKVVTISDNCTIAGYDLSRLVTFPFLLRPDLDEFGQTLRRDWARFTLTGQQSIYKYGTNKPDREEKMKKKRQNSTRLSFTGKKHILFAPAIVLLGFIVSLSLVWVPASSAQGNLPFIWQVQVLESDQTGLFNPVGMAFSSRANVFQVSEGKDSSQTIDLTKVTPFADRAGEARLAAAVQNPINIAYDNQVGRFLILRGSRNQLWEVREGPDGNLDPQTLTRHNIKDLSLQDPQGITVDVSGNLFVLDSTASRIVRVEPGTAGDLESATISEVNLGLVSARGIAFDATTGNLHVMVPAEQKLYELTQNGEIVNVRDLAPFNFKNPQAILFAPSGDQTDDPSQMDLFLADGATSQNTGQIVELSLSAPAEAATANFTSSLIRTTNMAAISPPSPDPSGITYLPNSNTLLVVDGEVEERVSGTTHFQGANVWELTLLGSKVRTANISRVAPTLTPVTNEPTGVTWNPSNGHYYVTDDDAKRVYDINPGADGLIGTADDTWPFFSTSSAGSGDPEGITFNTWNNHLFVADGVNAEIYEFTLSGTLINRFDVQRYGVRDPESVEFNPNSGTLFVMSSNGSSRVIVETTISGVLLQTIDISVTNARAAAGLAYAPASNGSGVKRFYIVDRGIDNNSNPNIVDGKLYEITAPASGTISTPSRTPTITSTATLAPTGTPGKATLISPAGTITNTQPTFTWNRVNGATWYYLWINGPSGNVFKKWYSTNEASCGGSNCSVTPAGLTLSSGNYTWWIQTWNDAGYGPWSEGMTFNLPAPPLPGKATLISPSGSIGTNIPAYSWNAVNGATWYYLWVDGPSGNVIKQWYTAAQVGCASGTGTCSITPTVTLNSGTYTWWIQTWNDAGYGPWSDAMTFAPTPPSKATLVAPTGSIGTNTPAYSWNAVNGATWYYLWISQVNADGSLTTIHTKWYEATQACSRGSCAITPMGITLNGGNYRWWVQTWNDAGYGPWSDATNFATP